MLLQIVHLQSCISQNLAEQATAEVSLSVNGDRCPPSIGLAKDRVASALPDSDEAMLLKRADDFCGN